MPAQSIPREPVRSNSATNFELHLRHRRKKLCICGHDGNAHNVLSCKLCDCEFFRQSAVQPQVSCPSREIQKQNGEDPCKNPQ